MYKSLIFILGTFIFSGCFGEQEAEKWTAFLYPNKNEMNKNIKSPMVFKSLEECKKASILQLEKLQLLDIGTFKCGLNCTYHEGMQKEICSKLLAEKKD